MISIVFRTGAFLRGTRWFVPHRQVVFVGVLSVALGELLDLDSVVDLALHFHILLFASDGKIVPPKLRHLPKLR